LTIDNSIEQLLVITVIEELSSTYTRLTLMIFMHVCVTDVHDRQESSCIDAAADDQV